jgi:NADPH-dependent glutamate synthase beta subunit-like oxidoreductase
VICIGGGDTSIDVVSVARRLGNIENIAEKDRPERVIFDDTGFLTSMSTYWSRTAYVEVNNSNKILTLPS